MTAKKGGAETLSLAKVLDLNEASALHGKLMAMRGKEVKIDASKVERVGALGVQVLMAAQKTWERDQLPFKFSNVSDAFAKTVQLLGVTGEHLMIKESA